MAAFVYCPQCAARLVQQEKDHQLLPVCPACGYIHWNNSKPCTGAFVLHGGKVLLTRRGIEPFKGFWDVPGGFLKSGEDPVEGVRRELREETGLHIEPFHLLDIIVDTYGEQAEADTQDYTLNIFYIARVTGGTLRPDDDAVDARWFELDALPPLEHIAFRNGQIAVQRLRAYLDEHQELIDDL